MSTFKFALLGLLHFLSSLALGSKCPENEISKLVVCYYEGKTSLNDFNLCNCTHIVLTNGVTTAGVNNISITEDAIKSLQVIRERNEKLSAIFTLSVTGDEVSKILKSENKSEEFVNAISDFLKESNFDGIEIDFQFRASDGASKESFTSFIKSLSKTLSSHHRRIKREGYDVFEKLDDITTASYTTQTPKNSTSKTQSIKQRNRKRKISNRKIREESEEEPDNADYLTLEDAETPDFTQKKNTLKDVEENVFEEKKFLLFVRLPLKPEIIAKKFDLKALSRYADILIVPTHDITSKEEERVTYHPSRLMGLADILNTDSILDFLTGMGGLKSKMVISLPATVLKFELKDKSKNTPRAPSRSKPQVIDQSQVQCWTKTKVFRIDRSVQVMHSEGKKESYLECGNNRGYQMLHVGVCIGGWDTSLWVSGSVSGKSSMSVAMGLTLIWGSCLLSKSNWTVERDDDLTAPYAFSEKTWLAFEDEISINIKGKYILLRELAGGAIYPIDADLTNSLCTNRTGPNGYLTGVLRKNFERLERKPRALVLESLQEEIHDTAFTSLEAGVKLSEYRIVRVVDHTGAVHVIRKNTKTQFECSRQGYFSHPLGCNKFYRCVKFDQYSDEFTVFEYDCPAGLAFDERWEVCVWPGSLPHGAPCTGSSEIAPVPRSHYSCPNTEGYYADPENCRWFFACLDHARDGITPLTAYEFRCPFGLVFSAEKLACDWPWLVGSCGNAGAAAYLKLQTGGQSQKIQLGTFINGGDLAASLGQYSNTQEGDFYSNFGSKFGKVLKGAEFNSQNSYQGAQSAGFGYIASQYNDNNNRASFASFPDYEISGGRILNTGGVVLDQNIAGITGGAAVNTFGINSIRNNVGSASGFSRGGSYFSQGASQSFGGFHSEAGATTQHGKPSLGIVATDSLRTSDHIIQQPNVISTPKPFSVSIPSVQINSEYLEHSTAGPTTSQDVLFTVTTPKSEGVSINQQHQYSSSQGFSATQPSVTLNVPVVTPSTAVHTVGNILSSSSDLKAPSSVTTFSTSLGAKSKPEYHRFSQSNFKQNGFLTKVSLASPTVSAGAAVTAGASSFGYDSGRGSVSTPIPVSVPVVTSRPSFEYSSGSQSTSFYQPTETPLSASIQENRAFDQRGSVSVGRGFGKSTVSVNIPLVQTHSFESTDGERKFVSGVLTQSGASDETLTATVTPLIYPNEGKTSIATQANLSTASSRPLLPSSLHSSIDEKVSNELYLQTPQTSVSVSPVTPKIQLFSQSVSGQVNTNINTAPSAIPIVTAKPGLKYSQAGQSTSYTTKGKSSASYSFPAVTLQPDLTILEGGSSGVGVTPIVPIATSSGVATGSGYSFTQTGSAGRVSYAAPQSETNTFNFHGSTLQTGKASYGVPALTSDVKTEGVVQVDSFSHGFLQPKVSQPAQQSVFGQRYSFEHSINNLGSFGAISSTSSPATFKTSGDSLAGIKKTEISIGQQPIVSVSTVSPGGGDQARYTPQPLRPNLAVHSVDFKNYYNQQTFVTTPAPAVSIIPSSRVTFAPPPHSLNVFTKPSQTVTFQQQQPENIRIETSGPAVQGTFFNVPDVTLEEKSSNLKQEIESFTPSVTTSVPLTYQKEFSSGGGAKSNLYPASRAYLPPVTPKVEIFGPSITQSTSTPSYFEQTVQKQTSPAAHQTFEFFGSKPFTEQSQVRFDQNQVTTIAPDYQQRVKIDVPVVPTFKPIVPQEKLVDFEITKSVEVNPSEFFKSSGEYLSQDTLGKSLEIQQQPLNLISQKTFSAKPVIQPFYNQQGKDISNDRHQEQFTFQQLVNIKSPKTEFVEQKQYLQPALTVTTKPHAPTLTYNTVKKVNFGQTIDYSGESDSAVPALPVFEASKTPIVSQKEISRTTVEYLPPAPSVVKSSVDTAFVAQQQQVVSPKVNLLLPTTTQSPAFVSSQTDSNSIHGSFDFQKINTNIGSEFQNSFSQPGNHFSFKSPLATFDTTIQNLNVGTDVSTVKFGRKYEVNPKISIPQPPKEYILAQNGFTTVAPAFSTSTSAQRQFQSTVDSNRGEFKGSTYLPPVVPSRKKPSKTTLISVGSLQETENEQELYNRYSGGFGQVLSGRNGKFVSKLVKGNGKGEIEVNGQGSSTVQYEISSTTPRPNTRGRQYHGGITSGLEATNKYEEYEIDGGGDGQRSLESSDNSKATLDLKNLKLEKNKKTVIVVSQVSDANPILVGKLAGQCSCQSNMLEIRSKGSSRRKNKNSPQRLNISNKYLPPFETIEVNGAVETSKQGEASTATPETVVIDGGKSSGLGLTFTTEQNYISSSTTASPELVSSTLLSSLGPNGVLSITPKTVFTEDKVRTKKKQFRGRARYLPPSVSPEDGSSAPLTSAVPAAEIASTFDYSALAGDESRTQNEINGGIAAGAAFDRYGPGGWRGFDEVLQGSVDCKRPGLFRHPKYCNKFYACNYDPWKERYTLHVFNCPIHLTYDSSISACNWPVRGPACADDNLLV